MAHGLNHPSNFKLTSPKSWFRVSTTINSTTILSRRYIYILPTRFGWIFGLLVTGLLTSSINYSISLGFAMTFLLAGLGIVSMLHSWRNLANIKISTLIAKPVFAGEYAIFKFCVNEQSNRARYSIVAKFAGLKSDLQSFAVFDINALGETTFELSIPSHKRGWLKAPRVTFNTEFPVSLFYVWAYAETESQCLIYPNPSLHSPIFPSTEADESKGQQSANQDNDDFTGHRNYQFGDSPKRIDWKASSREQGLLIKQFLGEANSAHWLDFNATTGNNIELRISLLAGWVVDAKRLNLKYGLRIPKLSINPSSGDSHYHQCLTALALM